MTNPFTGLGLVTQAQLLPVDILKACGVRCVRHDPDGFDKARVKALLAHYKGFGQYVVVKAGVSLKWIEMLAACGVTDIGVEEPDLPKYTGGEQWTVKRLAAWLGMVHRACPHVRIWGPGTSHFLPDWISELVRLCPFLFGLDSHYSGAEFVQLAAKLGKPCMMGENAPFDLSLTPEQVGEWIRAHQIPGVCQMVYAGISSPPDPRDWFKVDSAGGYEPTGVMSALEAATA